MSFRFYPTLNNKTDLCKKINLITNDEFRFYKKNEFGISDLSVSKGVIKDIYWDYRRDSLIVRRDLKLNDPQHLYGKDGIACSNAKLGIAILWSDSSSSMAGCILPKEGSEKKDATGWSMFFEHIFTPGEIAGIIDFSIVLYLKESASEVKEEEKLLNNKTGIILGELSAYRLQITDDTMPFPIVMEDSPSEALWWVDFFYWDDPAEDALFGPSSFIVTLNTRIAKGCPTFNGTTITNIEMLYEIIASVYTLLFKKLTEQQFEEMQIKDKPLPGTISSELNRVYNLCNPRFEYQSDYETINKILQVVIRKPELNT